MKVPAPTTEQLVDNVLRKARASRGAPVREQDQASRPQPARGSNSTTRPTDGRVTELVSRVLDSAARFVRGTGLLRGRRKSRDSEPPQEPGRTQAPPPGHGAGTGGARSDAPDLHPPDGGKNAEDIFWSGEKVPNTRDHNEPDEPSLLSSPWELSATGARSEGSGIGGLSPVPWQGEPSRDQEPGGACPPVDSPSFQLEEDANVSRLSPREPSSQSAACRFHVRSAARSRDVPDAHANVSNTSIASEETGQSPVHFDLAPESQLEAPAAPQQTLAKEEQEERQRAEKEVRDLKATIAELEERLQQQDEQLQLNQTRQQELSDDLEEARRAVQEHQQAAEEALQARQHIEKEVASPHPSSSSVQRAPSPAPECASLSPLRGDVGKELVHTWRHPAGEVFLSAVQACLPTLAASPASTASRSPPPGRHAHRGILAVPEEAYKANPSQQGGIPAHEAEVGCQHDDRLLALEKCMEETRRQLEVCLETAARSRSPVTSPVQVPEKPSPVRIASPERGHAEASPGHPSVSECPTVEVPDAHLQASLLLRSCLGNALDPPELLQKAQAMLRLKAAVGEIYAVLCLQTKAKSFLAQSTVAGLAQRRRPRPQTAGSGRSTQPRGAFNRSPLPPSSEALRRRATVQAIPERGRGGEAATGVTARRRWSSCPRPDSVPPLALELVQFGERVVPQVSPSPPEAVGQEMPASEEVAVETASEETVAAARGSAVFAARSLLEKDGKPTRPMSSPALLAQPREPRVVAIRPRQIKSASMARQSLPGRSRPASGMSRSRKAGGWEKSDIGNSQAELWLIKQRTLAGMLWPPMSEAARGRRPGAGCARPLTKAISDQQGCGCKPQEVQPLALKFAMAEAEILHEGEAS